MGETAENLAARYSIAARRPGGVRRRSRQRKAAAAQAGGRLRRRDRADRATAARSTRTAASGRRRPLEALAELEARVRRSDGTVTAGTSSPLTDGAAAVLVMLRGVRPSARPRSRWRACARSPSPAAQPEIMGIGPVPATRKALARAGPRLDDIDLVELNEAFAAQALACVRRARPRRRPRQPRRRRHRARPSAGRHRRADHRQGGGAAAARGRALRAGDPVHRRRPGHRHRARGGLSHGTSPHPARP